MSGKSLKDATVTRTDVFGKGYILIRDRHDVVLEKNVSEDHPCLLSQRLVEDKDGLLNLVETRSFKRYRVG